MSYVAPVNPYAARLEALDAKAGRVHTISDWHRVGRKAQDCPASVTDDDLVLIGYFAGESHAAQARARREAALTPPPRAIPVEATKSSARGAGRRALTPREIDALATVIVGAIKRAVKPLDERLTSAESQLTQMAMRPALKYAGVWRSGPYVEGALVTKGGGLWYATRTTGLAPGVLDSGWTLIVKRGGVEP